jgi:hypothetical protein
MSDTNALRLWALVTFCAAALLIAVLIDDQTRIHETTPTVTTTLEIATTTTTVDLSFLNTTTTTQPPAVLQEKPQSTEAFFECIRWRESRGNYSAVNSTGTFMGAYQFYQGGWDTFAARIGRHDLVGVPPHMAAPADQDAVALAAYNELGSQPWGGACQ